MFHGYATALITPFRDGSIDETAFSALIERQIKHGIHALVPCGTTGESVTLSLEEQKKVISLCVDVAKKRVPVIAGTGSNDTKKAIELTSFARRVGADAALIVNPYYNKPTQEGLYQHCRAISEATPLPLILYNIPGRTNVDMSPETMGRLAQIKSIIGVKDSTGDLSRPLKTRQTCGAGFIQLCGEDALNLAFWAQGGVGSISVASNIAPKECVEMYTAWSKGNIARAQELNYKLAPLSEAIFLETNPAPVKYGVSKLGLCPYEMRLPLVPINDSTRARLDSVLSALAPAV